jgi:hypothetical protein
VLPRRREERETEGETGRRRGVFSLSSPLFPLLFSARSCLRVTVSFGVLYSIPFDASRTPGLLFVARGLRALLIS